MSVRGHSPRPQASNNLVAFVVADTLYAVDIHRVQEIVQPLTVAPLPSAPAFVLGLADYRGAIIPVVDLAARMGAVRALPPKRSRWIVVRSTAGIVGLVVDEVRDVFLAADADHGTVPPLSGGAMERGIVSACRRAAGLVFVLDVDRVLGPLLELGSVRAFASTVGS